MIEQIEELLREKEKQIQTNDDNTKRRSMYQTGPLGIWHIAQSTRRSMPLQDLMREFTRKPDDVATLKVLHEAYVSVAREYLQSQGIDEDYR